MIVNVPGRWRPWVDERLGIVPFSVCGVDHHSQGSLMGQAPTVEYMRPASLATVDAHTVSYEDWKCGFSWARISTPN